MKNNIITILLGAFLCLGNVHLHAFSENFELLSKLEEKPQGSFGPWMILNDKVQKLNFPKKLKSPILQLEAGGRIGIPSIPLEGLNTLIIKENTQSRAYSALSFKIKCTPDNLQILIDEKPYAIDHEQAPNNSAVVLKAEEGTRLYILSESMLETHLSLDTYVNEAVKSMAEAGILRPNKASKKILKKSPKAQVNTQTGKNSVSVKIVDVKAMKGEQKS